MRGKMNKMCLQLSSFWVRGIKNLLQFSCSKAWDIKCYGFEVCCYLIFIQFYDISKSLISKPQFFPIKIQIHAVWGSFNTFMVCETPHFTKAQQKSVEMITLLREFQIIPVCPTEECSNLAPKVYCFYVSRFRIC